MNDRIDDMEEFLEDEAHGDIYNKIMAAKTLTKFFEGNKHLKLDTIVENFKAQEKAKINEYYAVKIQLLDVLHSLMKESNKEAILSSFDVFDDDFRECEVGHEVVILKDRNIGIIETLHRELDENLIVTGEFDKVEEQDVHIDTSILTKNIDLCNRKNNEIYGAKQSKFNKLEAIINRLAEAGKNAVEFFTYKEKLLEIGCPPKGVKDYENELTKAYIPLKKTVQKEFKIDLDEICNATVNEDLFQPINLDLDENSEDMSNIHNLFSNEVDVNPTPAGDIVNSEKKSETLPHKLESLTNKVTSLIDNEKKKNPFDDK